jgi:hypothetical protein
MLVLADAERDAWLPVLADTRGARAVAMLTTPTALVLAADGGDVLRSAIVA